MSNLNVKIAESIKLIQKFEKIALQYSPSGFHVAFSGGKDSQVIHQLCKLAGVKFKSFFYKTSVDPPELLKFIRTNYPEVVWIKPQKTMFQLILDKKMLPLRQRRFCCEIIKERQEINELVIIGVRREESSRRAKRKVFTSECRYGGDKILLSPILNWTVADVFTFLKQFNIEVCSLYKCFRRLGCVGCPMNSKTQRLEFFIYPLIKKAYLHTIEKLRTEHSRYLDFNNAEDVLNWWCSGKSKKVYFAEKKQRRLWDDDFKIAA